MLSLVVIHDISKRKTDNIQTSGDRKKLNNVVKTFNNINATPLEVQAGERSFFFNTMLKLKMFHLTNID